MHRIALAVMLGMLAGPTATAALAAGLQVTKSRELNCLIAGSASSKSVSCRGVLRGLAARATVDADSNRLPYDEFGLDANQPSQPRIGPSVSELTRTSPDSAHEAASALTATDCPTTSSGSTPTNQANPKSAGPALATKAP